MTVQTKDHVFPSSWYPTNTPNNIQRWTVPACNRCNNLYSKIEQELLVRIGICLDPASLSAAGLPQKALASLGVNEPIQDKKEKHHRESMRRKLIAEISSYDPSRPTLPGFGLSSGLPQGGQVQVRVSERMLTRLVIKVARGAEYKLGHRTIRPPQKIKVYFPEDKNLEYIHRIFMPIGSPQLGPGFSIQRAQASDDHQVVLYKMVMWGQLTAYVAII